MRDDYPVVKDLVLIGGGHAHALVARMWAMRPLAGVRLTLINPGPAAPYTGMLPGLIAGHYRRDEIMIDLVRLARFAGARLILDRAVGLNPDRQEVLLQNRPPLRYDLASLDIGIGSDLPAIPGYAEFGTAAKPLGDYAGAWEAFVARRLAFPRLVIVGGGVGGIELA
ncbi:MAG: FAD-dependent oxidoreductase, partial [Rhodobacteraceae bacterium]|nr:FAD-dependent oxidoreductase [Paracoccaceae bacterium]